MPVKIKLPKSDPAKTARRVARAVVGQVKPAQLIESDPRRKKPKYKKDLRKDPE